MDRVAFFDAVRAPLFNGHLSQRQVDGMTAILDEWDVACPGDDLRWLSYILATCYREASSAMWPIREWREGQGKVYGDPDPITHQIYYGRGFVQLTWKGNYARMGAKIGVDLVNDPDLALVPANAAKILVLGMRDGDFTTRKLADYFNVDVNDPVDARQIINGHDHASLVAQFYNHFLAAIDAATPLHT